MNAHAEQFVSREQQRSSAELGMWVFLVTELMFFGPLFLSYSQMRVLYPDGFAAASRHTDFVIGTVNTAVLLTSSMFMALAVRAVQLARKHATLVFLALTAALGVIFIILKGVEYDKEWYEHLVPWSGFEFEAAHRHAAVLFYFLYFGATGLHALHLTIGVIMVGVFMWRLRTHAPENMADQIEVGGLYWHFVDSIWVFLYPLIYLIGRAG